MNIPGYLTAGDTVSWVDGQTFDNLGRVIGPPDWSLTYAIRGAVSLDLTAVAESGGWRTTADGTATIKMPAGTYWWQAAAVRASDGARYTLGKGELVVFEDLAATAAPATSPQTVTAAVPISGHMVVAATAAGVIPADSGNAALAGSVIGIATQSASAGAVLDVASAGQMTELSWAWTPGQPLYAGPTGVLTQTPPTSGFVQSVAVAETATTILVALGDPVTL